MPGELAKEIEEKALACGFDRCGIVPLTAIDGFDELFAKRIADVPASRFFYEGLGGYARPRERFPWAKSIVVLLFYYGKFRYPESLQGEYAKAFFLEPERDDSPHLDLDGLDGIAQVIQPKRYDSLSDDFLVREVIPRTAHHLTPDDVGALRINAARAAANERKEIR